MRVNLAEITNGNPSLFQKDFNRLVLKVLHKQLKFGTAEKRARELIKDTFGRPVILTGTLREPSESIDTNK